MKNTRIIVFLLLLLFSGLISGQSKQSNFVFICKYPSAPTSIIDTIHKFEENFGYPPLFNALSMDEMKLLKLNRFPEIAGKWFDYGRSEIDLGYLSSKIVYKLELSSKFTTLLIYNRYGKMYEFYSLITYDSDFNAIDSKCLGMFTEHFEFLFYTEDKVIRTREKVADGWERVLTFKNLLINESGLIDEQKSIRIYEEKHGQLVKAENGILIKDSLNNNIGRYNYGDLAIIDKYFDDSTSVFSENGKTIRTRKVRVILDYQKYLNSFLIPSEVNNKGYIYECDLFAINYNMYQRFDYGEQSEEDEYYYYMVNGAVIGEKKDVDISRQEVDIKEFLEIENVSLNAYLKKIIISETVSDKQYFRNEKNVINLNFLNGTSRTIKDTTYLESEMQPSSHFELFNNTNLNKQYLIYHSSFEDSWFDLLDNNNGDTIASFSDYPFISPNNKMVISVKTPYTDGVGTCFLEINKIVNGKFKHFISIDFANWNIANNKIDWVSP
ncbi:MAG: hypothetical protein WCK02_10165 [Bacteroidota bacterium]